MSLSFGAWLKQQRSRLDLTQQELAEQVGCSAILIRKLEADDRRPSKQMAERVAEVLQIPDDERAQIIALARRTGTLSPTYTLPQILTSFVGRTRELQEIAELLANPQCRLLSLVGLGGIGKTRLAIQAAIQENQVFEDGACFVPLAGLQDDGFLASTIGHSLHLNFTGSSPPEAQLAAFLQPRTMLLVLDNFDHLLDQRDLLLQLLTTAPQLKVLVTSRQRLNLQPEWVMELHGLNVDAAQPEAVQLFMERAARFNQPFSEQDQLAIQAICHYLEGIPLGIELAASWLHLFTCQEIAQRIQQDFNLLKTDIPDIPAEHRSITQVFDQSWQLLSPGAQQALKQLSVFHGGFLLETALAITGATVEDLAELRDKSLLYRHSSKRFYMHGLLRQYAESHLQDSEKAALQAAHAQVYASIIDQQRDTLLNQMPKDTLHLMHSEMENIRVAWHWAIQHQSDLLHKIAEVLWNLYHFRQDMWEAAQLFGDAIAQFARPDTRAKRLNYAILRLYESWFYYQLGEVDAARQKNQEGLDILRGEGISDSLHVAHGQITRSFIECALGNLAEAEESAQQVLRYPDTQQNSFYSINALFNLGRIRLLRGDPAGSRAAFSKSLSLAERVQNHWARAYVLGEWGRTEEALGKLDSACAYYDESIQIFTEFNERWGLALVLSNRGRLACLQRHYAEAWDYLLEGLRYAHQLQIPALCLLILAEIGLLMASTDQRAAGIELLHLVQQQPNAWAETRQRSLDYLRRLGVSESAPPLTQDLSATIENLLAQH